MYDIVDLYKAEVSIPIAFEAARHGPAEVERRVRLRCRDVFRERRLLKQIIPDIFTALGL